MAFISLTPMSELEAVNLLLSAIGEAAVSSLETATTVEVTQAKNLLSNVNRAAQQKGWHFNTEWDVVLTRDTDDMESVFSQSTKEVVKKVPLSGAVIINQKMVESGDYYVQLVIKKRELMNELNERKEIYIKNLENANLTRKNIDDGMKVLDKMMDNLDKDIQ